MRNLRRHPGNEVKNALILHPEEKADERQEDEERERQELGIPRYFVHLYLHTLSIVRPGASVQPAKLSHFPENLPLGKSR